MTARRLAWLLAPLVALLSACCPGGHCIKDPPCRPCENPCCLSPIQKVALKASTHALTAGPEVYSYEGRTFILFSEKGRDDFKKDPASFKEKGALRITKAGKTQFVDVDPGDDADLGSYSAQAVPYSK